MNQQTPPQQPQPPIQTPCNRTIVAIASHSGLKPETLNSVMGCPFGDVSITFGISDTAMARNAQIDAAVKRGRKRRAQTGRGPDILVMIDDDMSFSLGQVELLICYANNHGTAVSAAYLVGKQGEEQLAATKLPGLSEGEGKDLFATGLGMLAMPFPMAEQLHSQSKMVKTAMGEMPACTWSAPATDEEWEHLEGYSEEKTRPWVSEDYRLCLRLNGVALIPIPVGHVKTRIITPELPSTDPPPANDTAQEAEKVIIVPDGLLQGDNRAATIAKHTEETVKP